MPGKPIDREALFGLRRVVVPTGAGMVTARAVTDGMVTARAVTDGMVTARAVTDGMVTARAVTDGMVTARAVTGRTVTARAVTGRTVRARAGRAGSDVATVLLHGAAGSWTTWLPLIAASDRAGEPLSDLVLIDLPGWGDSPGPTPSLAVLAQTVADVVRAVGYSRWRLVGHSLGGVVALETAARFPGQTVAVGLVSPSGAGVRDAMRRPVRGGVRLLPFAGMLIAMRLLQSLGRGAGPLLRGLRRTGILRLLAAPLFRSPVGREVTDALADEIRPASFVAAAAAARTVDPERWRGIHVPVRSVHGRRDVFARADDDDVLGAYLPDLAVRVLPDAGHFAHIEQPGATRAALGEVFDAGRVPTGSSAHRRASTLSSVPVSPAPA